MCCHNLVFIESPVNPVTLHNQHNSAFARGLKAQRSLRNNKKITSNRFSDPTKALRMLLY